MGHPLKLIQYTDHMAATMATQPMDWSMKASTVMAHSCVAVRSRGLGLALSHNQSPKERTMKTVELVRGLSLEPATTPDNRLFVDMTITSMSEDQQTHQRVFRLNADQLRLTARLIQEELAHLEGLTNRSGPSH